MAILLSWNLYHGTLAPPVLTPAGASPLNRLQYIANFALANTVDVVCLQEVPQGVLDAGVGFGVPGGAAGVSGALAGVGGFLAAYTVLQALDENNPNAPQQTHTTDGYLILFRNAAFPGGGGVAPWGHFGYYHAGNFVNQYGAFLRPPVRVSLADGTGAVTTILNWHAETGPAAGWSLEILDTLVPMVPAFGAPPQFAVGGDFNVRGDFSSVFGGAANFNNWSNVVATYPGPTGGTIWGLDHVLTAPPGGPVLGHLLNFTSDAYHYPIAANF